MYRYLLLLFLVFSAGFSNSALAAENEAAPFQNWWCLPVSEDMFSCTRFELTTEPTQAVSIVIRKDKGQNTLELRETAYLQVHDFEKNTLVYALPGTPKEKSARFTVESADSATKMFAGGTWTAYTRLPQLDAAVTEAMERSPAQAFLHFSGTLFADDGSPLLLHNPETRMVTPLGEALVKLLGSEPCAVRAYTETWEAGGAKAGTSVMVAATNGARYTLELNADNNLLSVIPPSSWDKKPILAFPLAEGQEGL